MKIVGVLSFLVILLAAADGFCEAVPAGTELDFKIVTDPEDMQFAHKYLIAYMEGVKPAEWDGALHAGDVSIARGDLNDDGVPEIFLLVENSLWCGSIGCRGVILQKVGDDWKEVGRPYFSDAVIMKEKVYGYHKLFTGDAIYTFRDGKIYRIRELQSRQITR